MQLQSKHIKYQTNKLIKGLTNKRLCKSSGFKRFCKNDPFLDEFYI